jgi:hypothetical protein
MNSLELLERQASVRFWLYQNDQMFSSLLAHAVLDAQQLIKTRTTYANEPVHRHLDDASLIPQEDVCL